MAKKSNFIKNLLTTASAVAVLAGGAQEAMAADRVTVINNAALGTGANWQNGGATAAPVAGAGNMIFLGGAHNLAFNAAIGNLGILNLAGNNTTVTVTQANELADIISDSVTYVARSTAANNAVPIPVVSNPAAKANFSIGGGGNIAQTFNGVTNLGTITFTQATATARFNKDGVTLNAASIINGNGGNEGIIEVNAANVTFNNIIGGTNAIGSFKLNNGKSATLNANITANGNIELDNTSTLTIGAGANVNAADIMATNAGNGTVVFSGASTVTAKIGNAANLLKVGIGAGTVEHNATVYKATTTEFSDNVAALKLSGATTVVSNFTTTINGKGKIIVNGNDQIVTGSIGADALRLEAIEFATDNALTLQKNGALDLYVNNITNTNAAANAGTLEFKADSVNIYGNIGTADKKLTGIDIQQNFAGGVASAVTLKGGSKVYAISLDMASVAAVNNTLALEDNSELHADVVSTSNTGTIQVKGNATIDGIIGNINKILFDTADKTLTVTKNNIVTVAGVGNGIDFTADGTLNLTQVANLALNAPLLIGADANGKGSIQVNNADSGKTVEIQGTVGNFATTDAATQALKLLQVTGGADIKLTNTAAVATAGAYIKKIDIGDKDVKLTLSYADPVAFPAGISGTYKIENFAHADGKGTVEFANNTTLKAGTVLSAANNKLNSVKFTADQIVTIEDGVNIYTGANGIQNNGVSTGTLIFQGGSVVDAIVGQNNKFKAIAVQGNGKSVDFKQDVNLTTTVGAGNGTITISDGATAIFEGNVTGISIDGAVAANQGIINFANKDAKVIDLAIGQTFKLNNMIFSGGDVKFNQNVAATNMNFTNNGATTATFVVDNTVANPTTAKITGTTINTTSTTRQHNIKLVLKDATNANTVVFAANNDIATAANQFGNFIIDDKMDVSINTTNFFAGVTTATAGKGTVNFVKNGGATTLNLGDLTNALASVTFTQNGTVIGVLNATTITVNPNMTATLNNSIFASGAAMTLGAGSTAAFTGDATVAGTIDGTAGKGTVTFDGNAQINSALGGGTALQAITFSSNDKAKVIALGEDLAAANIAVNGQTFRPTDNVTLTGASAFNGTPFDLTGNKNVTLTGGNSTISGNVNVAVELDTAAQTTLGSIIVDGANGNLDARQVSGFQVTVTDNAELPGAAPRTFTLISNTGGATLNMFGQDKVIKPTGTNRFADWTFDASTGKLTQVNNAAAVLQGIVGTSDPKLFADAMRIGDARNVGDARAVQTDFGKMTDAQIKDALGRLTNPIVTAADAVGGAISGAGQMTQNRIGELSQHPTAGMQTADSGISGVSAGDGDDRSRYGAWVSPFYNVANQSAKSGAPGYKATSYGTSIGADTMTNADMSLGVALSYLKTDVKHKNIKSGDKTKADTYMFSVYGIQQLTNEWFLQGVATFNSSKIKNSEKRGTSAGYQTAKGEYDATSYGVEALAGYLYSTGEVKVTPLGGIAVSRFNDGGYKETGTTSQNLTITRKAMSKLEGILGARVEMANVYAAEGMELVPELHAYARHNFLNQNAKVTTKLDGQYEQSTPKTAKANKTMFNLGASLNSKSGMYEYGAGYDLNLSNKYVGHQGTVKVRVNF